VDINYIVPLLITVMRYITILVTLMFLTIPILMVEAAESGDGEYKVTPGRITLSSILTLTGDESSEIACIVDAELGDDNGIVESSEVYDFEVLMEEDTSSSHSMNSVQGVASDSIIRINGMTGDCDNGDTITINIEGVITFDLSGDSSSTYTLKYFTDDDAIPTSVSYDLTGYQINSATGLGNDVLEDDSYSGTREGGTTMVIEFQEEENDGLPGFLILPSIAIISVAAVIYKPNRF